MEDKDQIEASIKWLDNPMPMRWGGELSPADQLLADGRHLERLIEASLLVQDHTRNREVLDRISRLGGITQ